MTILQSRLSGMYFKDFGVWVATASDALRFPTPERARQFIAAEHLADLTVCDSGEGNVWVPSPGPGAIGRLEAA